MMMTIVIIIIMILTMMVILMLCTLSYKHHIRIMKSSEILNMYDSNEQKLLP